MGDEKPVQKLLRREMSRREFLGFAGATLLAVVGVTGIIRNLNGVAGSHVDEGNDPSAYGVSVKARRVK